MQIAQNQNSQVHPKELLMKNVDKASTFIVKVDAEICPYLRWTEKCVPFSGGQGNLRRGSSGFHQSSGGDVNGEENGARSEKMRTNSIGLVKVFWRCVARRTEVILVVQARFDRLVCEYVRTLRGSNTLITISKLIINLDVIPFSERKKMLTNNIHLRISDHYYMIVDDEGKSSESTQYQICNKNVVTTTTTSTTPNSLGIRTPTPCAILPHQLTGSR
ncbi:hypothetical protein RND71_025252 [Anisodus tanguticus]|uniref:Uncharacterized protein n=1 Tax=Anisodus tanguticus TaxID=243964 RepID=A0AAE1RR51_9SOLA|nr:hypothetical protein RND71_025252 [Anisodus tanguticus]